VSLDLVFYVVNEESCCDGDDTVTPATPLLNGTVLRKACRRADS